MARKVIEKPGRNAYWDAIQAILYALLDEPKAHLSSVTIEIVQHQDHKQFYGYILLRAGEVTEERYDLIRQIVRDNGGALNISDTDRIERGNLRIWPIAKDA